MLSKRGWEPSSSGSVNHLFFGSSEVEADLSSLHPKPAHILKLWQLYLENVGPLLGVTHNTSLQGHIINAVGDVQNIKPSLEALMFSIYCMSSIILTEDECEEFFSSPKADLLSRFRFGCQQALLKCGFLQTKDRDCLTALFLYLVRLPLYYYFLHANPLDSRSRSQQTPVCGLCRPCLPLQSASVNV